MDIQGDSIGQDGTVTTAAGAPPGPARPGGSGAGPGGGPVVRRIDRENADADRLLDGEWVVANGLGGYASATLSGALTRRYHGLLIAALPAPLGRMVLLSHLMEQVVMPDGTTVPLAQIDGADAPAGNGTLSTFLMEDGLPVWRYRIGGVEIEKRLSMPHRQNIVHVSYRLAAGSPAVRLRLRPSVGFRPIEGSVASGGGREYRLIVEGERFEISAGPELPTLRLKLSGEQVSFTLDGERRREVRFRLEAERGYDSRGTLWSPGGFEARLEPGAALTVTAGSEEWRVLDALEPEDVRAWEQERRRHLVAIAPPCARQGPAAELVLAADSFLMTPAGRVADIIHAYATGDEVRSVIAGYHWFTDWGRDTMISLEGLTLCTGRPVEAGWILRTFAKHIHRGLIPNLFPEGGNRGLYHTADATLWFFHALNRYLSHTGDRDTLRRLLPRLLEIVEFHRRGTEFGIRVDPDDGLLMQGEAGYQLTWMDAKVDDWVVTPRRGKAVEINALWYNALSLTAGWLAEERDAAAARPVHELAALCRDSFNRRFWNPTTGHLFDVVDGEHGDDPACRPNQIFAVSLDHPVLARERWQPVLDTVRERLLTPVGLRSLAPGHRDYKERYFGDLRARDAAYHQGTVWGWLIGPYVDAHLKLNPDDKAGARALLEGFWPHLSDAGVGTISEIFDAEPPFTPRGCIAQAWSVAEVLRCWVKTA
ncbi:amylo-alpha-1,6-glucosidase [Rhodocista pekingensis]|uniref:Amylo-alpha-1,6-glucosidase n=1 Tax=Rhodocista pekingensis TaxID=201185 RepID=A0ABW2KNZ5_9PROT